MVGKIYFTDQGRQDHKWIFFRNNTIRRRDWMVLDGFFRIYAQLNAPHPYVHLKLPMKELVW